MRRSTRCQSNSNSRFSTAPPFTPREKAGTQNISAYVPRHPLLGPADCELISIACCSETIWFLRQRNGAVEDWFRQLDSPIARFSGSSDSTCFFSVIIPKKTSGATDFHSRHVQSSQTTFLQP